MAQQLSKYNRRQFYTIRKRPDGLDMIDFLSLRWIKFAKQLNNRIVTVHIVKTHEVGRLWTLSQLYYGDDTLDWILAIVNNILDPIGGMFVGQKIAIPSQSVISQFYNEVQVARRLEGVANFKRVIA